MPRQADSTLIATVIAVIIAVLNSIFNVQSRRYVIKPAQLSFYGKESGSWIVPDEEGPGPARAAQVLLMSVSGVVKVERGFKYRVSFTVSLKEDAFGWQDNPVQVTARLGNRGTLHTREVDLSRVSSNQETIIPPPNQTLEVLVPLNSTDDEIHFGLYETKKQKWKGGLEIHCAKVEAVAWIPSR